jgi:hypothetical protein
MIGEIAARLSGGYMSGWTYPHSSGVRPIRAAVLMAMGREPGNLVPEKNWTCAERAFISIPGTVTSISGLDEPLPGVRDKFSRISAGSAVHFPENNVGKCGNIISAAPDRAGAIESAHKAAASILIRLDPSDSRTADFLLADDAGGFPPNAFHIGAGIRAALEQLPETCGSGELRLYPFPEFVNSGLADYTGRSIPETLAAIRKLTGLFLPEFVDSADNSETDVQEESRQGEGLHSAVLAAGREPAGFPNKPVTLLGRSFWKAFIRGTYQGAVYYIDTFLNNENH